MALEATLINELEVPVSFPCAEGTGINKGTFVKITEPNTVVASGSDDDAIIGITAEEKIASDGNTQVAVFLRGIFKATIGAGGCTAGDWLSIDSSSGDDNEMATIGATQKNAIGMALETGTDLQTVKFLLSPNNGQP